MPKPRLVNPSSVGLERDTNKLHPLTVESFQSPLHAGDEIVDKTREPKSTSTTPAEFAEIKRIRIRAENSEITEIGFTDSESEEIEDLAHLSMRFGAGLFDFIIAAFTSLVILSPVALSRGEWLNWAGLLSFAGVCAIVLFFYMTVSLGFYGKTMGMRLFSLELVDAVENEYPTLHQAAVSSSVFLLSCAFGGIGFLTVFLMKRSERLTTCCRVPFWSENFRYVLNRYFEWPKA